MNFQAIRIRSAILKQSIRDVGSSNAAKKEIGLEYFLSEDFGVLSEALRINADGVRKSILKISDYPQVSRQKMADKMARTVDKRIRKRECLAYKV